jgi:glycosyltransferase involved in cell wall biosynthesis
MRPHPRISVVIPSFNQKAYLAQCLDSVLGQNYPNLEVILMDGGSTDGSTQIIEKFKRHFYFVQVQPDGGQVRALNRGLFEIATGAILTWLNSDDYWANDILEEVSQAIEPSESRYLVCGRCRWVIEPGAQEWDHPFFGSRTHEQLLRFWQFGTLPQCSLFFHRDLMLKTGKLDVNEVLGFDYQYWLRLTQRESSLVYFIDRIFSYYRQHQGAKTMSQHHKSHQDLERISRQFWPRWWHPRGISIRLSYHCSASPYKPQEHELKNIVLPGFKEALTKRDYIQVAGYTFWTGWHCPRSLLRWMLKTIKFPRLETIINIFPPADLFQRSLHRALRRQRGPLLRQVSRRIFNVHPAPPHQPKTRLIIESKLLSQAKTGISFCARMPDKRASAAILTCKLERPDGHVSQRLSWMLRAGEQTEVQAVLGNGSEGDHRLVIETEMMPPASNNYYASVLIEDLRLTL